MVDPKIPHPSPTPEEVAEVLRPSRLDDLWQLTVRLGWNKQVPGDDIATLRQFIADCRALHTSTGGGGRKEPS